MVALVRCFNEMLLPAVLKNDSQILFDLTFNNLLIHLVKTEIDMVRLYFSKFSVIKRIIRSSCPSTSSLDVFFSQKYIICTRYITKTIQC